MKMIKNLIILDNSTWLPILRWSTLWQPCYFGPVRQSEPRYSGKIMQ